MLASAGVKAPADELPKAAMVHEQVAKRIANVRFTTSTFLQTGQILGRICPVCYFLSWSLVKNIKFIRKMSLFLCDIVKTSKKAGAKKGIKEEKENEEKISCSFNGRMYGSYHVCRMRIFCTKRGGKI
ncbi:MAG: hypothetical protein Q4B85_13720 [Lachnospiraceae bacterium]|nr:hypothetical protein [Lachnospiraceae bacterium]